MHTLYVAFAQKIQDVFRIDARYFLSGGFWLLVAQATTVLGSLLVTVYMTRLLSENDFGVYRYVIGIGVLLSSLSLTGIGPAIIQATAKGHKDFLRFSTPITLTYSSIISIISLLGAGYYLYQGNSVLGIGCLLIAVLQPVQQFFLNTLAFLHGEARFKVAAQVQTYKSIFVSGITLLIVFFTTNLIILLFTYFVTQALSSWLVYRFCRPKEFNPEALSTETITQYLHYAKHSSLRNVIAGIAQRLDTIIIFQHLGAPALALYSVATLVPDHVKGSFKNMQTLLIPKYTRHESLETIKKSIPRRSFQFFIVLVLLSIAFAAIIPYFYTLLFPGYTEAIYLVQLLALAFPASIYLIPFGAMQAHQLEKELYLFHVLASVTQLLLLFVLLLLFGMIGAIWSKIIGQYLNTLIAYLLILTHQNK